MGCYAWQFVSNLIQINVFEREVSNDRSQDVEPGGGGGTLMFTSYVGMGPASTAYLIKISGISGIPPKNI